MHHITLRLPADAKKFIELQAERFGSSMNSEIIRSIRERMEKVHCREMPAPAAE
ncbi:Arc family DNA-binding protein [Pararhizobium sp. DWP1-1-3]|uniref:Arc family DNA-binding protein n=1 Tax=Pararhizobium sp. DWP1-1-3 TaxID=2804652 RepID=UPI003CE79872